MPDFFVCSYDLPPERRIVSSVELLLALSVLDSSSSVPQHWCLLPSTLSLSSQTLPRNIKDQVNSGPEVIKLFSCNSTEHEISTAN